jgi:hypothetical protein
MKRFIAAAAIAAAAFGMTGCETTTTVLTDEFGQVIDTGDFRWDVQLNGTRPEARNEQLCEVEWGGLWISEKYVCEGVQFLVLP